jgi:hypothetical protein
MQFFQHTFVAGSNVSRREWDSAALARPAVDVFGELLECQGDKFREEVPVGEGYELQWDAAGSCAQATFWHRNTPVMIMGLLSGHDPEQETALLKVLQEAILAVHGGTAIEPAWDMKTVTERPAIFAMLFPGATPANPEKVQLIDQMATALAAAYFESLGEQRRNG